MEPEQSKENPAKKNYGKKGLLKRWRWIWLAYAGSLLLLALGCFIFFFNLTMSVSSVPLAQYDKMESLKALRIDSFKRSYSRSDYTISRSAGGTPEYNSGSDASAEEDGALVWNAWFKEKDTNTETPVPSLDKHGGARRYTFYLDLSWLSYVNAASGSTERSLREKIKEALHRGETFTIYLRPVILGKSIEWAQKGDPAGLREFVIQGERFNRCAHKKPTYKTEKLNPSNEELAKTYSLADNIVSWEIRTRKTGCGAIAVSIWDTALNRPLDYVLFSFPVTKEGGTKPCEPRLQATLNSLLLYSPTGANGEYLAKSDAALHLFQPSFEDYDGNTEAIFINGSQLRKAIEKLRKARENKGAGQEEDFLSGLEGIYSWRLRKKLSEYMDTLTGKINHIHKLILDDNNKNHSLYQDVALDLKNEIFGGDVDSDHDITQALAAFQSLKNLVDGSSENSQVTVFVDFIDSKGNRIYLPFSLLSASGENPILNKPFVLAQQLPHWYPPAKSRCVDRWALAIPPKLGGVYKGDIANDLDYITTTPVKNLFQMLPTHKRIAEYLSGECKSKDGLNCQGSGFVFVGHHGDGELSYDGNQESPASIKGYHFLRRFEPGSVAFLAACSTSGAGKPQREIIHTLSSKGFEAIIMSPLPVDPNFGVRFALKFVTAVDACRRTGGRQTLLQLFQSARKDTQEYFKDQVCYKDLSLEFSIAGLNSLSLCNE